MLSQAWAGGWCRDGILQGASRKGMSCLPNDETYDNFLCGLCKNNDYVGGVEILEDCLKKGRVPDIDCVMMLLKGLMNSSKTRVAKKVIIRLRKKFPKKFACEWRELEDLVWLYFYFFSTYKLDVVKFVFFLGELIC